MTGKELLEGMNYIDPKFIAEAGQIPAESKHPLTLRRSLIIAAIVAMMLMLVGCAVVYVLSLQEIRMGQQQTAIDSFSYDPETGLPVEYLGKEIITEQVFTVAGLRGTPAYQAAQEWFAFKQSYDPDMEIRRTVWGNEPEFPAEYGSYNIYTQEMKDKLDEIVAKYDLKLVGGALEFRTVKNMCQALGIEKFQTAQNELAISVNRGSCRENGNFSLSMDISFPEDTESELTASMVSLNWNRKDCFTEDVITFEDTGDWKEWNYTTTSGNEVLITRSPSDWRGYIICDREEAILSLQVETRSDVGYNVDGKSWWEYQYLTDRQMEQIADAIDFGIQPRLVSQEDVDNQPEVPASATQNGYTVTLKSVETDGYVARVLVGVTAPEGTDLESLDIDFARGELLPLSGQAWGSGAFNDYADGDGLAHTKDMLLVADLQIEDDSMPFASGTRWNLHIEDLWVDKYLDTERLLAEGEWEFPITFDASNSDDRELQLLSQPIQADACIGWKLDGTDVLVEFTVTSFKLRKFSSAIEWDLIDDYNGEKDFGASADFYCWTGHFAYAVMKDGTKIQLLDGENCEPVDLDQADHVLLADGTKLKVSESSSVIELLSEPVNVKFVAGYTEDANGNREDLHETMQLTSVLLYPTGAAVEGYAGLNTPDMEIQVYLRDGSSITLHGSGSEPSPNGILTSRMLSEKTVPLDQAAYLLFPDGTKLPIPEMKE